jgi:hypothetical protein
MAWWVSIIRPLQLANSNFHRHCLTELALFPEHFRPNKAKLNERKGAQLPWTIGEWFLREGEHSWHFRQFENDGSGNLKCYIGIKNKITKSQPIVEFHINFLLLFVNLNNAQIKISLKLNSQSGRHKWPGKRHY